MRIRADEPYQASPSLPRTFAVFFRDGRLSRGVSLRLVSLVGALGFAAGGCEGDYSSEPTFCDEWCAALRHPSDCAEGPASCVRDCELTKASEDCFPLQEQLLECYQELEPDAFMCAPPGSQSSFGDRQRVDKEACRSERDALFECEAPGFGQCLALCRGYQTVLTEGAVGDDPAIAPAEGCPLLVQPCETICWTAFVFTSDDLGRLLLPTSGPDVGNTSPPPEPVDAGGDAGAEVRDPIAELFAPCFEVGESTAVPN